MHFPHPMEIRAKQRRKSIAAAILILLVAFFVYLCWPQGPFYRGRSLKAWLQDFTNPLRHASGIPLQNLSAEMGARMEGGQRAVKAIGTNAIPTLLQYVQAKDSGVTHMVVAPIGPRSFVGDWFPSAREKHAMAQAGFTILGKDALPAQSALVALTKDSDPTVRMTAFECLFFMVQPDYKTLTTILVPFGHDPDRYNRERAAEHMRMFVAIITPEEAEKAGVYEAFPELRSSTATGPH
jgi:hypothetical protein